MAEGTHNNHQQAKNRNKPGDERNRDQKSQGEESKSESDQGRSERRGVIGVDSDHNDIPPSPSPAFSTSLSSPSLLALGKGRKIGLASNPTVARNVGLDIPEEPIIGRENPKFGWVKDCI